MAVALRVQELQNRSLLDTLVSYLKNKTLLLILDNCEHVIDEIARVAAALLGFLPGPSYPRYQSRTAKDCGRILLSARAVA